MEEKIKEIEEKISGIEKKFKETEEKSSGKKMIISEISLIISIISLFVTAMIGMKADNTQTQYNSIIREQNEREKKQIERQQIASMPKFLVTYQNHDKKYTVNGKNYKLGIECRIKNKGGILTNPVIHPVSFFLIRVENLTKEEENCGKIINKKSRDYNILTNGIIINEMPYYNVYEDEFTINLLSNKKIDELYKSLSDGFKKSIKNNFSILTFVCFEIEYEDIYGDLHKEWYDLTRSKVTLMDEPSLDLESLVILDDTNVDKVYLDFIKKIKKKDKEKFVHFYE